ncbi:hypothetical protein GWI33_019110 [Rhynchophorus ferrugineus]|uniref:Uncharacterized protein n=1 Tax=Rhynchophorus ferrugineus TaxID=354439 RepID=A0A834HUA8_RHYFE|nr:hypothetical protein GWI33_019110 [Rhynchophorus ferrugineus]
MIVKLFTEEHRESGPYAGGFSSPAARFKVFFWSGRLEVERYGGPTGARPCAGRRNERNWEKNIAKVAGGWGAGLNFWNLQRRMRDGGREVD